MAITPFSENKQLVNKTFESHKMSAILDDNSDPKKRYYLIDVDNTLTAPFNQEIGSAQWRQHIKKKAIAEGYSPDEAEDILDL